MVGAGGTDLADGKSGHHNQSSSQNHQSNFIPNHNDPNWRWPRRGMRGGAFYRAPRMFMGGFFPGPRAFGIPPQNFYNPAMFQRKPRPGYFPRGPRIPLPGQFPPQVPDPAFIPSQPPPNWPQVSAPSATTSSTTEESQPSAGKKKKRSCNGTGRPWDRDAAVRALKVETECQKNSNSNSIVVRFPDPELSKEIVHGFHPAIENVHFQAPCGSRYCFVTLDKDADPDKVMNDLNNIRFGCGNLKAERKVQKNEETVGPENIDPFTLYVGNLPTNISTVEVKEKFPTATRIDVGYAQKLKYTRYAFVRYDSAEAALEAFRESVNTVIASRSIILRFRRHKAPVGPPGEKPAPCAIETTPGVKLTVGAKLKAKRDKAKAEKDKAAGKDPKPPKRIKLSTSDGEEQSSSDEEVELENDSDVVTDEDEEEDDDDDDDDDDDEDDGEDDDDGDDEEDLEDDSALLPDDDPDDPDDPDDDDPNIRPDEDDDYEDDDKIYTWLDDPFGLFGR